MRARHMRSWMVVLSLFFLVVLLCIFWERLTSRSVRSPGVQLADNPEPALAEVRPRVAALWAIKKKGQESHVGVIGCGLIVDYRGYVLTSVALTPDIESLYVIDSKNKKYEANIITTDETKRLTLLKIDTGGTGGTIGSGGFEAAYLGDSDKIRKGDGVIALGGSMVLSSWELTTRTGSITKERQSLVVKKSKYQGLIQTDI